MSSRSSDAASEFAMYLLIGQPTSYLISGDEQPKAMYRLCCRECGTAFEEGETPVESRSIKGAPLVHEECA